MISRAFCGRVASWHPPRPAGPAPQEAEAGEDQGHRDPRSAWPTQGDPVFKKTHGRMDGGMVVEDIQGGGEAREGSARS